MRTFKNYLLVLLVFIASGHASAQIFAPVKWSYSSVKDGDGIYTLLFTASIDPGWHIYSHVQPKKSVAERLAIKFTKGEGTHLEGNALEVGKLEKFSDESLGIYAYQYSDKLVVRQRVKLKNPASKQVSGVLRYQTCNDVRCLPAEDVDFVVKL
ncbi:protein-disulfide reductase DsbD domain-containing protein [Daejeonella lutea]|uniref:Disulphide bond corrector protein DsbC n=1 Tax=Daejeonella lutea TaxID=572036 RepID=A0A1T5AIX8_9SPHI|nr:protein-disulfide reductase DsbD domain-containing protein [Daejeonella lutea]SKB34968.1 Disulphide bond corrector protein DsbC [Daejeonella lutea]